MVAISAAVVGLWVAVFLCVVMGILSSGQRSPRLEADSDPEKIVNGREGGIV